MPATEAQILANRRNAALSTGPKTPEGKEQSRRNALKHGMTGDGVVLAEADAAEVDRRAAAFARETDASGEIGLALARNAALNSVRMERAADRQTAALAERVRRVEAEFVAPEGASAEEADMLRSEAARIAMFDPSKEAGLARKYEAAAERGFFRAIKELRQLQRSTDVSAIAKAQAEAARKSMGQMASFFPAEAKAPTPARPAIAAPPVAAPAPAKAALPAWNPAFNGPFDVPITIGRPR